MGKNSKPKSDWREYQLTGREFNYLKILNAGLTFHTWQQKIISGFLYHICNTRLGYGENVNLLFEVDLDAEEGTLKVKELDAEAIAQAEQTA